MGVWTSGFGAMASWAFPIVADVSDAKISLLMACLVAFVGVMGMLGALSLVIMGITRVFPARVDGVDWATRRAVELAIDRRFPGARVTEVRETAEARANESRR